MLKDAFRTVKKFNFLARRNVPRVPTMPDADVKAELAVRIYEEVDEFIEAKTMRDRLNETAATNYLKGLFFLFTMMLLSGCAEMRSDFPERRPVPAYESDPLRPIAPIYSEELTAC